MNLVIIIQQYIREEAPELKHSSTALIAVAVNPPCPKLSIRIE